jgi:hypothetical protein
MRTPTGIFLLALISIHSGAVCHAPLPRLVCAEYFHSKAIVIARLAGITRVRDSYGDITGTYYSMTVERTLHGEVPRLFRIYEANDSGRADFIWDVDESYLLFLLEQSPSQGWLIDGCGNSGPSELRGKAIQQVEAISSTSTGATIQGAVGGRSSSHPIAGVQIEATGPDGAKTAQTNRDGRFAMHVSPGKYQVRALSPEKTFIADDLSYEDPGNLVLQNGGCAQVQFVESTKK